MKVCIYNLYTPFCINVLVLHLALGLTYASLSGLQPLFEKYLEYEKSFGDEQRIEYVKRKAMEYAEDDVA